MSAAMTIDGTAQGVLRLGTRGSALARAQSGLVAAAIGAPVELVTISTKGDRDRRPVEQLGSTGVFVSALRDALLERRIDLAVHSYKDLPTAAADGLTIVAVPPRVDARDALVARDGLTLAQLPAGARVGTGATRRVAQLRAYRPDLQLVPIRGNVDTRLAMVADGSLDAVVLAYAGLLRLDRCDEVTEVIDSSIILPAPAQGALAVECRCAPGYDSAPDNDSPDDNTDAEFGVPTTDHSVSSGDDALRATLAALNDPASRATVTAERALLATLEAGCTAPIGAHAQADTTTVVLDGAVAAVDGSAVIRRQATGPVSDAGAVGQQLAADLLAAGASDLLGSSR